MKYEFRDLQSHEGETHGMKINWDARHATKQCLGYIPYFEKDWEKQAMLCNLSFMYTQCILNKGSFSISNACSSFDLTINHPRLNV